MSFWIWPLMLHTGHDADQGANMGRKKSDGGKKKVLFAGAAAALAGLLAKRKRLDRRSR